MHVQDQDMLCYAKAKPTPGHMLGQGTHTRIRGEEEHMQHAGDRMSYTDLFPCMPAPCEPPEPCQGGERHKHGWCAGQMSKGMRRISRSSNCIKIRSISLSLSLSISSRISRTHSFLTHGLSCSLSPSPS